MQCIISNLMIDSVCLTGSNQCLYTHTHTQSGDRRKEKKSIKTLYCTFKAGPLFVLTSYLTICQLCCAQCSTQKPGCHCSKVSKESSDSFTMKSSPPSPPTLFQTTRTAARRKESRTIRDGGGGGGPRQKA